MKKLLALFAVVAMQLSASAQTAEQWQQIYGGPGVEVGYGVRSCLDQGYIVVGATSSSGPSDGYIVRTDSVGLVMWEKTYGGTNVDIIRAVELLPDSGFIMSGYTNSFGNGGYDCWILRTDKNGDTLWTRTIGTSDWDFLYDVETTWDNKYVFAGGTYGAGMGDEDMMFLKLDSLGATEWSRTYGGLRQDEALGVIETVDSMFVACGYTMSRGDTLGDSWILRINSTNGDTIWSRTANHPGVCDKALGITRHTPGSGYIVVGETSINGDPDAYVQGVNLDSTFSFYFVFGGAGTNDFFNSVVAHANGTFAALGYSDNFAGGGNGDYYFFTTRNGWFNTLFGTFEHETSNDLDITHDDGYIACGSTEGFGAYQSNMHLVKLDTNGVTTTIVSVQEHQDSPVYGICSVYPNPSNGPAVISINTFEDLKGELNLQLYDCTGREVLFIPNNNWLVTSLRSAQSVVNTTDLSDGVYHYTISDELGGIYSGRLVVAH